MWKLDSRGCLICNWCWSKLGADAWVAAVSGLVVGVSSISGGGAVDAGNTNYYKDVKPVSTALVLELVQVFGLRGRVLSMDKYTVSL